MRIYKKCLSDFHHILQELTVTLLYIYSMDIVFFRTDIVYGGYHSFSLLHMLLCLSVYWACVTNLSDRCNMATRLSQCSVRHISSHGACTQLFGSRTSSKSDWWHLIMLGYNKINIDMYKHSTS